MKRREFITVLGGAAVWPMVAHAQQPVPVIGLLALGTLEANAFRLDAVRDGLRQMGLVEGRDLAMQYRWADLMTGCRNWPPVWWTRARQ
jgi:putative tryptophan/tyrosine transport system substrate-binding protein